MWDWRCKVLDIHDGDTVRVYKDEGQDGYRNVDVRLFGTFAPELSQAGGRETLAYAKQWVQDRAGGEWPFVVTLIRNKGNTHELQTFGRWVGMLWTIDMTENLNVAVSAYVVAQGYGGGTGSKAAAERRLQRYPVEETGELT